MKKHDDYYKTLYDDLNQDLNDIKSKSFEDLETARLCIEAIKKVINIMREHVIANEFLSIDEEIFFFKVTKPMFYWQLIYYGKIVEIELNKPIGSRSTEFEFLKKEQLKLAFFFDKYSDFYKYYRNKSDYLDKKFFLRNKENPLDYMDISAIDTDPKFTTLRDYIVAKILANEQLKEFLEDAILRLKQDVRHVSTAVSTTKLSWTATKVSLIELLYGLQSIGVFNNGDANIQQVANFFEQCFNVKLGNYYKVFQEIRIRKNRVQFLDEVKKKLLDKMEISDENPKIL